MRIEEKILLLSSTSYELRRMWVESNARIHEIRRREQKAIAEKRFNKATEIAYLRIDEQKRNTQILGQITGAL